MGMFDTIRWKRTEPYDPPVDVTFQSKDIRAEMDSFEVREDGSLWMLRCDHAPDWDFLEEMGAATRPDDWKESPPPGWKPCDHTGQVCFYDGDDLTYTAVFDKGQLLWVGKADRGEYYRPRVVKDHVVELIKHVLQRNEQALRDIDRDNLEEAIRLVRAI